MTTETERKFLVTGDFRHLSVRQTEITQAYLSVDPERTVRIRLTGDKACLTIKGSDDVDSLTRNELEIPVDLSLAEDILKLCLPGIIRKTRYYVPSGKHIIEVDVFHEGNEGLILAEIELSSEDEKYLKPSWLGEEVTGIPEYYNVNLRK